MVKIMRYSEMEEVTEEGDGGWLKQITKTWAGGEAAAKLLSQSRFQANQTPSVDQTSVIFLY